MSSDKKINIIQRIEKQLGIPNLSKILAEEITSSDLESLLLMVYHKKVSRRIPHEVLADYHTNKFFLPSQRDPLLLLEWDHIAFSHLPKGYDPIELSPIAPLGCVSSLAPISQDWILTSIRNMELLSIQRMFLLWNVLFGATHSFKIRIA